jgi:hypothetical protein
MASDGSVKVIKFVRDNDFERYKLSPAEPIELIDSSIRRRFGILADASYHFLDEADGTVISFFSLHFLENESIVHVSR